LKTTISKEIICVKLVHTIIAIEKWINKETIGIIETEETTIIEIIWLIHKIIKIIIVKINIKIKKVSTACLRTADQTRTIRIGVNFIYVEKKKNKTKK